MDTPSPSLPLEETVAVVGVGLIGGSLAAALKQRNVAGRVIGVGRNRQRLEAAQAVGLIDDVEIDLRTAAARSSIIVVCTPVDRIAADVRAAAGAMRPGSLITDAGSAKTTICRELAELATGPVAFIGSHPLAGSEKQGFEAASATLFDGRMCVLTPLPVTPRSQVERTARLWQAVGMQTCELSPEAHDAALAFTSHLPHAVAAALASALPAEYRQLTATGFRDTTRVAAGDPELWTAIFAQNSESLLAAIEAFSGKLGMIRDAIHSRDAASLQNLLRQAKTDRMALDATPASSET